MQLAEVRGAEVHCIETNHRKCSFLREAARATRAPAIIHATPIQFASVRDFGDLDGVTARAVAPLTKTLDLAHRWLETGAVGVFPIGESVNVKAIGLKDHEAQFVPSSINLSSCFLKIRLSPIHACSV
jgi:16S rRNA G527 N7-methylase RsmG